MKSMKKATLALVLVLVLSVLCIVPALAADGDLVWSLGNAKSDVDFLIANPKGGGVLSGNSGKYEKAGSGIKISERSGFFHALDLTTTSILEAGKEYTVIVGFSGVAGETFQVQELNGDRGVLVEPTTSTSVKFKVSLASLSAGTTGFRLCTPEGTNDYTVTSILIYEGDAPANANPKTGDYAMLGLALAAVILAGGATVFFARKVKKVND